MHKDNTKRAIKIYTSLIKNSSSILTSDFVQAQRDFFQILNLNIKKDFETSFIYIYVDEQKFWEVKTFGEVLDIFIHYFFNFVVPTLERDHKALKRSLFLAKKENREIEEIVAQIKKNEMLRNITNEKRRSYQRDYISMLGLSQEPNKRVIPLLNGYYDGNLVFRELDKNIFNKYVLPFEHKKNYKEPTKFLNFISKIMPDKEKREFLLNWLAYMLVPINPRQNGLFLQGGGANGKSVLLKVIEALAGGENCSNLTIGQLKNDKNGSIGALDNKVLNLSADSSNNEKIEIGTLKNLVTGEIISYKSVYKDTLKMKFEGKLVFAVNKVPYFEDKDYAVMRRLEILSFDYTIKENEKIPDFEKILIREEGSSIFLFLIDRLRELSKIKYMFKTPKSVLDETLKQVNSQDNVSHFVEAYLNEEEFYERDTHINTTKDINSLLQWSEPNKVFFKAFKAFAKENHFSIPNFENFKSKIYDYSLRNKYIEIDYTKKSGQMFFHFKKPLKNDSKIGKKIDKIRDKALSQNNEKSSISDEDVPF